MSYNWGPHYIVPSKVLKSYSDRVQLREQFDEELLKKELETLDMSGSVTRVTNPWYYRKKENDTWIKIGESEDRHENFPVSWDTRDLDNGQYEILGLMHVSVNKSGELKTIARQNMVEITIEN